MKPAISVILPIRNEEKFIDRCLESILAQDFGRDNFEILIVDGNSTDSTISIIKAYQQKYDNIKLLHNPKRIAPTAMNIGISAAKADIIIRIDGHVRLEKDYFSQCLKTLELNGAACVGGGIESINETNLGKAIALAMSCRFGVGNARFRISGSEGYVDTLAFGAYRKSIFQQIGLFDEQLIRGQDEEFNYRLRKFGGKIYYTPKIKSYYFPRTNLNKLWNQYFGYGFWKIRVLQKHPKMMQPRQFIPPLFVSALVGSLMIALLWKVGIWLLAFIVFCYLLANLFFSLRISLKNGIKFFPILPVIFMTLHFSNGTGFLAGLIKFPKYWSKKFKETAGFVSAMD